MELLHGFVRISWQVNNVSWLPVFFKSTPLLLFWLFVNVTFKILECQLHNTESFYWAPFNLNWFAIIVSRSSCILVTALIGSSLKLSILYWTRFMPSKLWGRILTKSISLHTMTTTFRVCTARLFQVTFSNKYQMRNFDFTK